MSGRAVIVAGGSGAIGKAITRRLLADAIPVVLLGRRPTNDPSVSDTLRSLNGPHYIQCDVADPDAVERAARSVGPLRAGVFCAGVTRPGLPTETPPRDVWEMIAVNALGLYFFCLSVGHVLAEQGGGSLLSISSWAARVPERSDIGYGMSKAAGDAAIFGMAAFFAASNVRANVVSVGVVGGEGMAARHMEQDPEGYAARVGDIPLGRPASVGDVANAARFLISDEARYITGALLSVDGGAALRPLTDPHSQSLSGR